MKTIFHTIAIATLLASTALCSIPPKIITVALSRTNNVTVRTINGSEVSQKALVGIFGRLAKLDASQTIIITADETIAIAELILVRRQCKEQGLTNILQFVNVDGRYMPISFDDKTYEYPAEAIMNSSENLL